jgi:hypothetical protein
MSDTDSDPAPTAATQFSRLFSEGFPKKMLSAVAGLALQRQQEEGPVLLGSKRNRQEMPAAAVRIRVWRKVGDSMPELQAVAVRLLSAHATSAATELSWSLWGCMYCAHCLACSVPRR